MHTLLNVEVAQQGHKVEAGRSRHRSGGSTIECKWISKLKGVRTKKGAEASFFNVAGSIELKLK
jgi:hypothetical protein